MTVVVIGGGATGLGVAWDLILRNVNVVVVERGEIGFGTSGRFHGLLHSGARYAVTDPDAAKDCMSENTLLRRLAPTAIELTGGYFVRIASNDQQFEDAWINGTTKAGIPVKPVSVPDLHREIPGLAPEVVSGFQVPDAVLEGFAMMDLLARAIVSRGGEILRHHRVDTISITNDRICGATVSGPTGSRYIGCDAVINAAGPWAGEVAALFGVAVSTRPSHGLMVIFANRRVPSVINRLQPPSDGDIFVPHQSVTILGTTDVAQTSPDAPAPTRTQARELMALGRVVFPDLDSWRVLRAFTGVRPLYDFDGLVRSSRDLSRSFSVLHHAAATGPQGAFSVLGGKWTTFRLMGEKTGDMVSDYLGIDIPCRTRETPIAQKPQPKPQPTTPDPVICECEEVTRSQLIDQPGSLAQSRLATWFSMGPCQGTFCLHRVLALHAERSTNYSNDPAPLRNEREQGLRAVLWGDNARQLALQRSVRYQGLGEEWAEL
ncbi:MAG: FAD-dependent oxidoreductase [Ferrimicrobium sp.]